MYVIGYPKSGNTWLCFLLAYCLNTEYDDLDSPGIHPTDQYQRRYVKGGLAHTSYQNEIGQVLKTHRQDSEGLSSQEPLVYLLRDGRDVMVSYYFFLHTYINPRNLYVVKRWLFFKIRNLFSSSFKADGKNQKFSAFLRKYTDEWVTHVSGWLDRKPTAVIRYEDLKISPEATLNRLFEQLDVQVAPEVIQQALKIFDFQQLSQRPAGEENRQSFFRKGVAGDWKNHFSAADLDFFHQRASKIMRQANYDL